MGEDRVSVRREFREYLSDGCELEFMVGDAHASVFRVSSLRQVSPWPWGLITRLPRAVSQSSAHQKHDIDSVKSSFTPNSGSACSQGVQLFSYVLVLAVSKPFVANPGIMLLMNRTHSSSRRPIQICRSVRVTLFSIGCPR